MRLVVDTSTFIALYIQRDQNHTRARAFFREQTDWLYTNNVILGELYTHMRYSYGYQAAMTNRSTVLSNPGLRIAACDAEMDAAAYLVLARYPGIVMSYEDATLIALGERLGISEVLSFDSDFRLAGFSVYP